MGRPAVQVTDGGTGRGVPSRVYKKHLERKKHRKKHSVNQESRNKQNTNTIQYTHPYLHIRETGERERELPEFPRHIIPYLEQVAATSLQSDEH